MTFFDMRCMLILSQSAGIVDVFHDIAVACATGQYVPRMQTMRGIAFSYQPPPRNIVPYAAALKGQSTRCVA